MGYGGSGIFYFYWNIKNNLIFKKWFFFLSNPSKLLFYNCVLTISILKNHEIDDLYKFKALTV